MSLVFVSVKVEISETGWGGAATKESMDIYMTHEALEQMVELRDADCVFRVAKDAFLRLKKKDD